MPRLAYLIPEFPGQTHVWMWREIAHLKQWGVDVRLHSTRPPKPGEAAKHRFAESAAAATRYLWPLAAGEVAATLAWLAARPMRAARCSRLAMSLPVDRADGKRPKTAKLLLPAAVLARRLVAEGSTHLHVHSCASAAVLAMKVRELVGIPFSMTLNADLGWWGGAMREKMMAADFTVAITQRLVDEIDATVLDLPKHKRLLGRIGVDTRDFAPRGGTSPNSSSDDPTTPTAVRSDRSRDARPFTLITVARLHPSKGHDVAIRAVATLRDRAIDVALRLAGAGPQADDLRSLVRELNVDDRVTFLGSIGDADVLAELRAADAFVLASHAEPLGVAYMEAMACGLPTIGTAAGGVGEIITDGVDGLLVPPRDVSALADAIERLVSDATLRERLSIAGRRRIVDAFDSRIGAATLYERLYGASDGWRAAIPAAGTAGAGRGVTE